MPAHGVFTRRYTSVSIKDGAGTPLSRTVGPGPGDFTFSDRKSTRLNSSHVKRSRMPSSA